MEGTRLADMYRKNLYTPPTFDTYTTLAARALSRICDSIIVHRITGDCPRDLLVAPDWNTEKQAVIAEIRRKLSLMK
jgi:radical SAM superfamily enzyme